MASPIPEEAPVTRVIFPLLLDMNFPNNGADRYRCAKDEHFAGSGTRVRAHLDDDRNVYNR